MLIVINCYAFWCTFRIHNALIKKRMPQFFFCTGKPCSFTHLNFSLVFFGDTEPTSKNNFSYKNQIIGKISSLDFITEVVALFETGKK